jgi:hypothetical protein
MALSRDMGHTLLIQFQALMVTFNWALDVFTPLLCVVTCDTCGLLQGIVQWLCGIAGGCHCGDVDGTRDVHLVGLSMLH